MDGVIVGLRGGPCFWGRTSCRYYSTFRCCAMRCNTDTTELTLTPRHLCKCVSMYAVANADDDGIPKNAHDAKCKCHVPSNPSIP